MAFVSVEGGYVSGPEILLGYASRELHARLLFPTGDHVGLFHSISLYTVYDMNAQISRIFDLSNPAI